MIAAAREVLLGRRDVVDLDGLADLTDAAQAGVAEVQDTMRL